MFKKDKIFKFRHKCTKFENILKKGRWWHVIITPNKLLEKALHTAVQNYFEKPNVLYVYTIFIFKKLNNELRFIYGQLNH